MIVNTPLSKLTVAALLVAMSCAYLLCVLNDPASEQTATPAYIAVTLGVAWVTRRWS